MKVLLGGIKGIFYTTNTLKLANSTFTIPRLVALKVSFLLYLIVVGKSLFILLLLLVFWVRAYSTKTLLTNIFILTILTDICKLISVIAYLTKTILNVGFTSQRTTVYFLYNTRTRVPKRNKSNTIKSVRLYYRAQNTSH